MNTLQITLFRLNSRLAPGRAPGLVIRCLAIVALVASLSLAAGGATPSKRFATPEEAVVALAAAVNAEDTNALRAIFGSAAAEIENPDRVQATNEFRTFAAALQATNRIVRVSDGKCVLEVGENGWPFPVPLVKEGDQWFFDTAAGKEEILNRRIGKNELAVLQAVRAYVDAQREYASRDRTGDEVLEYAQRLFSSPGTKDGLYWPVELDGELSPLGPLMAEAQGEGYEVKQSKENAPPTPFHGYYFRILTRQGRHAPGGKYRYIINGHMIAGFGLVAWPARYGESGIMTFIVNQQGRVYEKDLGPKTAKLAPAIKEYAPDSTWRASPD